MTCDSTRWQVRSTPNRAEALLRPSEVAARLGVTLATLERWRCGRSGPALPFIKLGQHGAVRYRESDLARVIAGSLHGGADVESAA